MVKCKLIDDVCHVAKKVPFLRFCRVIMKVLADRRLHVSDKWNYFQFGATTFGKRNLFASLPRSGTTYTSLLINVAYDLSKGGNGNYYYKGKSWVTNYRLQNPFDWRSVAEKNKILNTMDPHIFHTHLPYDSIVLLQKRNMKTVVLVRNIFPQLTSRLFQAGFGPERQDEFVDSSYFLGVIDFLNSWGKRVKRCDNCSFMRYKDLVEKPLETLGYLSDTWNLHIGDEFFLKALDLCKRSIMLAKVPQDVRETNDRVSPRQYKFDEVFTDKNKKKIKNIIRNKLQYDFGYKY